MTKIESEITEVLAMIAEDMANLLITTIEDPDVGWNNKTGTNTLKNSNLVKTIKHKVGTIDNPVVEIYVNDYIEYIERGRHIHHTPRVPLDALADWVSRKLHKQPTNKLLYAIQQSIYQKGIRPRPIIYYWMQQIDKEWDRTYADLIFDTLTKDLDKILK
jgi:hypothetical protein